METEVKTNGLKEQFFALQNQYRPLMDILTIKQDYYRKEYGYRGFDASPSTLIYQPKILFLAYNPSGGKDWEKLQNNLPLEPHLNETGLMFFDNWGARKGEWYKLNKSVNNPFPRKIVDLLYELASLMYPDRNNEKGTNERPFWAVDLENSPMSMMFLNLYPIATPNGSTLISLCKRLCKEESIPERCKKQEWDLRQYMIDIMRQMIELIDPKVVVCMGAQTFHDYTKTERSEHSLHEILSTPKFPNVIGFSRRGAWESNIPNIAKEIYDRII